MAVTFDLFVIDLPPFAHNSCFLFVDDCKMFNSFSKFDSNLVPFKVT